MQIKNPDDAKLAPFGKLSNMQIRAAITEISFLGHNSIIIQDKGKIVPLLWCLHLGLHGQWF